MEHDTLILQMAASAIKQQVPKDGTLSERLSSAMRAVLEANENDLFWMSSNINDDLKLRTALAVVMIEGSENDVAEINRSLAPLRALDAATRGIPVDFSQVASNTDNIIPVLKLWNDAKNT